MITENLAVTLHRNRQAIHALRGVDLRIHRGEIIGLVGESGSGKSVLGASLLGLLPDTSSPQIDGTISVDGVDVVAANQDTLRTLRRHHLGAVFQDPMASLDPTMRVGNQLMEVAGSTAEAVQLLEAVGIPEPARRLRAYPHELSGGLRQRVMIATAVAGEPRMIIADEPTTALDVTVQAQILELLVNLRDELGCAVLFITHDLAVAAQIADRIAVLYAGRLAEVGPTASLLADPRHPYTAGLLRSRLDLDTHKHRPLPSLEGDPPDPAAPPPGCPFVPRCPFAQPACEQDLPPLAGDPVHLDACIRSDELELRSWARDDLGEAWPAMLADSTSSPVVAARDVTVSAVQSGLFRKTKGVRILNGVDLEIRRGEAVALVGESGSGKTTFMRTVAGLMDHDGGHLSVSAANPQMIYQDPRSSLTSWLTIGELIEDRLRNTIRSRAERAARVAETLASVGLRPEVAAARPTQLSGGQCQRAAIARAIVQPPELLLCDEPTSSLDVSVAASVLNAIGDLRRRLGIALLFVTHDLAVARLIADRVAVMYLGRIVETGPVDAVIRRPAHPYTRALLSSLPGSGAERTKLSGEPPSLYFPPSGCAFHPRCPAATASCAERGPRYHAVEGSPDHIVDCVLGEA